MDIILYITGGLALLALTWAFIALARAIGEIKDLAGGVKNDLRMLVADVDDLKHSIVPILNNVTSITASVSSIAEDARGQLADVQKTVEDVLDIVRGTIEDAERLKNEVVATVEGPLALVRGASGRTVITAVKLIGAIRRLVITWKRNSDNKARSRHKE